MTTTFSEREPVAVGARIGGRFELLKLVGSGGMGTVWRALDHESKSLVALKLTEDPGGADMPWSEREARALLAIQHPSIPTYVAHGVTSSGAHYIAMEWLDGEDLAARLAHGPLTVEESLALAGEIADALAVVHAKGIVHCDIKPSNIFLVGGDLTRVKLMDFGIARLPTSEEQVLGGVVGTPSYMAPEQTYGSQHVDARSDLYALGGVLFECLTGRLPFTASNAMAALTKAIFESAPLPSEISPGLPRGVDALVADLLAKDKNKRPHSAEDVSDEVDLLLASAGQVGSRAFPATITRIERRLVSVVLAVPSRTDTPIIRTLRPHSTLSVLPKRSPPIPELRDLAQRFGAELKVLGDGSIAAILVGSGAPTDMAVGAARYALALRKLVPHSDVAVVTGWQGFTGIQPVGEVIDRASRLLSGAGPLVSGPLLLDAMTAALLSDRFPVSGDGEVLTLSEEREPESRVPSLLGKPSPCIGRERELWMLEDAMEQSVDEPAARAVLVTAGPGTGKSRVLAELLQRWSASGDHLLLTAYGDPTQQKVPFGMLARAVRRTAGVYDGEPEELRRQKLAARVGRHVSPSIQRRVAEFLGEMVGTSFPWEDSVQLRAARGEPMLMGDQMRRAWVDFLEAECAAHPVLIVLEDLHWADRPTVDFIDTALRLLDDRPLFVLATARPEVADVFPHLWAGRSVSRVALGELPRSACETLVRTALGDKVSGDTVARIVERSACNAFFLEELVRAVANNRGDELPDTVLAMMQSRLHDLDTEHRRALRAGSVLGARFWRGAVAALIGVPSDAKRLTELLDELLRQEWITVVPASRFRHETEYAFRHALVRDAAYGMLTEDDRALGHRIAASWLEKAGELTAMVLAEHYDGGGEQAKAALAYVTAARQALEGNDLAAAIARAERAIACGVSGPALGDASLVQAEAHRWQGHFDEAVRWAHRALDVFQKGSESWFNALREALASLVGAEDKDRILEIAGLLDELWTGPDQAVGAQVMAMSWMAVRLYVLSLHERAETQHCQLRAVEERFSSEPAVHACIAMERAMREGLYTLDMSAFSEMLLLAVERFERTGDVRSACHMKVNLGHAFNELGAFRENVALLSNLLADAKRLGVGYVEATAHSHLGKALFGLGDMSAARTEATLAVSAFSEYGEQRMEGVSRAYLAIILSNLHLYGEAEVQAENAIALLEPVPTLQPFAWAVLASVFTSIGRTADALGLAARAAAQADQAEEGEVFIRLVHVEALNLVGRHVEARRAIEMSEERLLARAQKIADTARRKSFLEAVPENFHTMQLAQEWRCS